MSWFADRISQEAFSLTLVGIMLSAFWFSVAWGFWRLRRSGNLQRILPEPVRVGIRIAKRPIFLVVLFTTLTFVLLAREERADSLLIPLCIAFLTIPVVPRVTALLIVTCCFGLAYLLHVGDAAIAFATLDNTARRLLWSAIFLVLVTIPFICMFRSLRTKLSQGSAHAGKTETSDQS